jgi:hypothetical protein
MTSPLSSAAHLGPEAAPCIPAPPYQMTHSCREEKTIGLNRAIVDASRKGDKRRRRETRGFLEKEKICVSWRLSAGNDR